MNHRSQGLTLIELMVVMAITGILGLVLLQLMVSSRKVKQVQQEQDLLQQNMAIAGQMLQIHLVRAGYRGGAPEDHTGTGWTPAKQAEALGWMLNQFGNLRLSGAPLRTVQDTPSTTTADLLGVLYLQNVNVLSGTQYRYVFRRVTFSVDTSVSQRPLRYNEQLVQCDATPSTNTASCVQAPSNPQPALDGTEDLQVFYQNKRTRRWSASKPATGDFGAIGVYVRLRTSSPDSSCTSGPVGFPGPQSGLPEAPSTLGIPVSTYQGSQCKFRRLERTFTFLPVSQQQL